MMQAAVFRQFFILLYKGALLRKRHYIVTFFEIIIPILITSLGPLIYSLNSRYDSQSSSGPKVIPAKFYEPFDPYKITSSLWGYQLELVYCPTNPVTDRFMEDAYERFKNYTSYDGKIHSTLKGVKNENDLEKYSAFRTQNISNLQILGTVFHGLDTKDDGMSDSLDYTIRYGSQYSSYFATDRKYSTHGPTTYSDYKDTPFLSWQTAVEETFIDIKAEAKGKSLDYKVWMQRFPYPEHVDSDISYLTTVPYLITYAYFIFIINMIRRMIEEKSNGSKELLKMMGMSDIMYWTSTFINYFIVGLVTMLITAILYKVPLSHSGVFVKQTDFSIFFMMLMLYMTQLILFGMTFSIFFNKGVFAIIVYIIVHDVSFGLIGVFLFISDNFNLNYLPMTLAQKLSVCLIPEGSLQTMLYYLSFYDSMGKGISWSNVNELFVTADLTLGGVFGMTFTSCLIYVFMIWYFDAVWPWQPGVPKPFYFMFTKSYWNCGKQQDQDKKVLLKDNQNMDFFEEEPTGTAAGVSIKNLSKEFRTGLQTKLAVNDVSLNIYQGQITALLGHNGAGKTTTINILTGLYTPTSGTASINGLDILQNTTKARRGLGVCPQHNVLFDTLTPEEHLKLYAALKGVPWKELGSEAAKTLELLRLTDKKKELVKTLSGGMKRKLSLGIAIVGGSKVLFLDEPTSGMDVEARRGVWDTLKEIRPGRTIILTTHYMEEADILGDRIAIMAEGEIQCCGSSMFLKQKLGTGYHLHVVKNEKFNLQVLTGFLAKHMPGASVESENKTEVNLKLSSSSDEDFGKLFEEMEQQKNQLGIDSYGITITTMEDVFLNVANIADMKYKMLTDGNGLNTANGELNDVLATSRNRDTITGAPLLVHQMHALLLKRLHYAKRHWSILVTQLALPFLILCIFLYLINYTGESRDRYGSLKLDLDSIYGSTEGFYNARKPEVSDIAQSIKSTLEANKVLVNDISDPTPYILNTGKKDMSIYWMKLIVGGLADVLPVTGIRNLTAWYNGEPFHGLPISLNLMHNTVLKNIGSSATITLTNAPLPPGEKSFYGDSSSSLQRILSAVFVPLALAYLCASSVILPINERVSKAKLLQLMSGVPTYIYWLTMFIWDYLVHFVLSLIMIIPFAMFSHSVFFSPHSEAIGTSILLILLYGWASMPFSYLLSLVFKKGNVGYSVNISISAILGIAAGSVLSSMGLINMETKYVAVDVVIWILRFFPPFSVTAGFSNLFGLAYTNAFCGTISKEDLNQTCYSPKTKSWDTYYKCCPNLCEQDESCLEIVNPFTWEKAACGRDMFALAFDGCFYFALLLLLESTLSSKFSRFVRQNTGGLRKKNLNLIIDANNPEDTDVVHEKERVLSQFSARGDGGNEALVSLGLAKAFKNFYAVDHLTFGIHQEECFGLLGVNGAGKTTTFRMLTGDCFPGEGNAFIQTHSLTSNLQKFQSYLGYCPQFDALIDRLTGREMLTLFGRLRGLSGSELEKQVNAMIRLTDLQKHADKQSRVYSGGNKRKLSIGIALIGFPPLILLDEPTAGVDPVSRRKIWNVLAKARNDAGSAVLLTTHSMEETEALCSRLAIMVNGQFRCLGSIQHLKSKYGQGYTLKIKTKSEMRDDLQAVNAIKEHVQNGLRGAELKDEHQGMLQYQVTDTSIKLSHLFKFMSETKSQFNLEDYLISETTLEQIFLTFARGQRITSENAK